MTTKPSPAPVQVLVAFDLSPGGKAVIDRAVDLACRAPNHILHFVSAIDPNAGLPAVPGKQIDYRYAEQVQNAVTAIAFSTSAGTSSTNGPRVRKLAL